jgi:hypothetical protein
LDHEKPRCRERGLIAKQFVEGYTPTYSGW